MTEEELKELNIRLCELFEDIYDCLTTSEKFNEMYFIRNKNENTVLYELVKETVEESEKYSYVFRIETFGKDLKQFLIPIRGGYMKYTVNQAKETVTQQFQDKKTGKPWKYDSGLRMNEDDILQLEEVLEWCEEHHPDYW